MLRTPVFSAFGAGLAVCVAVSALQFVTTEPLILHAEEIEGGAEAAHDHGAAPPASLHAKHAPGGDGSEHVDAAPPIAASADNGAHVHDDEDWAPADGLERAGYTVLANLVIGFAVSLMLLGAMALKGDPIDSRRGLAWGVAGFAAMSLLPALGLPPELPGTPAADIVARQLWWLVAAAASAAGIALIAFARHWGLKAAGVALIVAPHLVGAPQPPSHDVAYPGALAGEFVVASLIVSALLWSLAGLAGGWLYQRLSRDG
jgi:cobalt transporter subunit CbtA